MSGCSTLVALGDSLTAGTAGAATPTWPLLLGPGDLDVTVLARDGATTADVLDAQLPAALELRPDVVTLAAGANDVLRTPRPDVPRALENLARAIETVGAEGHADVILLTYPPFASHVAFRPRSRQRITTGMDALDAGVRGLARRFGVSLVDLRAKAVMSRPGAFASDSLHPSESGHARIAKAMAEAVAAIRREAKPVVIR